MKGLYFLIVLFFAFASASVLPSLGANTVVPHFDEVWVQRGLEAWNRTLESYEPEPEKIVHHLNKKSQMILEEAGLPVDPDSSDGNTTRRELEGYAFVCQATNPIDRCWRCDPNWADNRQRLADCVLGFGYKATGGKGGKYYVVTDPSDNDLINPKNGTLRHAVIQKEPLWIIFARDMIIRLTQELIMQGDKTIDARGAQVIISNGAGITIQYIRNVIIHGLRIYDIQRGTGGMIRDSTTHWGLRTESDGDGISIFGAQDIWIDHVSMRHCQDGLIDAIMGSTGITISNSHFTDHNDCFLFGASDSHTQDEKMQITVAFNHFGKRLIQRMPRARFGYVHVVNNDYTHWMMYAIGGSKHPTFLSQGNRFIAPPNNPFAKEVTKREYCPESVWKDWVWKSEGDIFLRDAFFVQSGDPLWSSKHPELYDKVQALPATQISDIVRFAGSLGCRVGEPC